MNKDVVIGGKWRILNKYYNGDLTFNKANGIILLSIYYKNNSEFLAWMNKPINIETITGKLNQEIKCTLTDCQIIKRHSDAFVRHHVIILAKNMFLNISKSKKEMIKFNEVRFQIPNIIKWSCLSGFEYINDGNYKLNIGYKFKEKITQIVDDETTIEFVPVLGKFNFDMQVENLDISQHVEVYIKKKEEVPYQNFFDDFNKVINLITLATGFKINISHIHGINYKKYSSKSKGKNNYIKYEIVSNTMKNLSHTNPDKHENISNYLFYLKELPTNNKLYNWFDSYETYKNIYNLYNLAINNEITDEIKFCNLMQAMELIHTQKFKKVKKFYQHIETKFENNSEIINLIEDNPDQKDSKFIILKNRIIDSLISDFSLTIRENLIANIDKLSTILADTRNFYTHYNESKKDKCLVGKKLKFAIFILDYVVSCDILLNLGFSIDEINQKKEFQLNDIHNAKMIESVLKNDRNLM